MEGATPENQCGEERLKDDGPGRDLSVCKDGRSNFTSWHQESSAFHICQPGERDSNHRLSLGML